MSFILKAVWSIALVLISFTWINAQTFNGSTINTAGNSTIPSAGTGGCAAAPQTTGGTTFNNTVAGLAPTAGVASVLVNFPHTFDSDIDMFLQSPSGQIIELSTDNGAGNDNYTNTNFVDGAPNITTGAAPFTGNFAPEGTLTSDVCGVTITPTVTSLGAFTAGQNGTWQLRILDDVGGDIGTMLNWSITFGAQVPPCLLTAPANIVVNSAQGFCGASPVVPLPISTPAGCLDGVGTGLRYSVDGGNVAQRNLPQALTLPFQILQLILHTIVWQSYLIATGITVSTVSNTVTIVDTVAPTVNCPGDIVISLDPGACSSIVGFTVTASDNCPFLGPTVTSQVHGGSATNNNNFATITFGVRNDGPMPIVITGVNANLGDFPGPGFVGVVNTRLLFGPINGAGALTGTNNIGAWTATPSVPINVNVASYYQTTLVPIAPANQFTLQPGQARGIAVQATNGNFMRYANGNETTTNGTLTIISNGHWAGGAVAVLGNTPRLFKGSVRCPDASAQNFL